MMSITAVSADGNEHIFPDDTDKSVIDTAMKKYATTLQTTATPQQPKERSWADVGTSAIQHIPESTVEFGKNIAQPFLHPVQTAESLGSLGLGVMEKLGVKSGSEHEKYADAFGDFLVKRYGSMDAVKNTLATDPVGMAADLSMFLTGGETALARIPATTGKIAETVGTVGRMVDPLRAGGKLATAGVKGLGYGIGEVGTHTGGRSILTAGTAGYEGGESAEVFQRNLRRQEPMTNVVQDARAAVDQMRQERGASYREAMKGVAADKTVLNFEKIDKALADITEVGTFHGKILDESTQAIRAKIGQDIQEWKTEDPEIFHTPEGLDALKRKIGNIKTEPFTREAKVVGEAYHAIGRTITDAFPEYAKIMKGYEEASDLVREMEQTLTGKPDANVDTALRKLQSVLRNNVNTNYGRREELADYLVRNGAPNLLEKLAGQALNPAFPRGFGKLVGSSILSVVGGLIGSGHFALAAGALAAAPLMSPRLMGEAAYYTGKAASYVPKGTATAGEAAFQAGRTGLESDPALANPTGSF
jgi:hypothetical protein